MNLVLVRKDFTDLSTIGELRLSGESDRFCHTLELSCRRANPSGKLAIVQGKYKVIIGPTAIGNRFRPPLPFLPLLVGVPERVGIRIHPANKPSELEGCIAVGDYDPNEPDWISNSRPTFDKLFQLMKDAGEDIFITIVGGLS